MKKFIKSVGYALAGIKFCFKQSNFRIQFAAAVIVMSLSLALDCSPLEITTLLVCCALVLSLEMMNTAIEQLCDSVDKNFNPRIKIIKDVAAGAVLLSSIITAIVGLVIFLPHLMK